MTLISCVSIAVAAAAAAAPLLLLLRAFASPRPISPLCPMLSPLSPATRQDTGHTVLQRCTLPVRSEWRPFVCGPGQRS